MELHVIFLSLSAAAFLPASGALVWTGAGDGISLYQEANWLDNNSNVPDTNTVNPNTIISADTGGVIEILGNNGSPSAFGGGFSLGDNDLHVGGGKILGSTGSSGINGIIGQNLIFSGGTINVQYITNLNGVVSGSSILRYRGGGNPINNSLLDFVSTDSVLQFTNETFTAFQTEHESKVTYNGAALIFGADPLVEEPGDNAVASAFNGALGVQINFVDAVPEPGAALLAGLGVLLILRRRK
ncbi:MAG: PEP-CTERM sorting domain-containing protein [Akkermansiaceae bacterium]